MPINPHRPFLKGWTSSRFHNGAEGCPARLLPSYSPLHLPCTRVDGCTILEKLWAADTTSCYHLSWGVLKKNVHKGWGQQNSLLFFFFFFWAPLAKPFLEGVSCKLPVLSICSLSYLACKKIDSQHDRFLILLISRKCDYLQYFVIIIGFN